MNFNMEQEVRIIKQQQLNLQKFFSNKVFSQLKEQKIDTRKTKIKDF